ncbi:MAG: phenylalanine--tRNA ligase subunit beta [Candidatus Paceibacteria bacterium]
MKISYNWLKSYIPDMPEAEKLRDIFTYHLCEVESVEKWEDDTIFDINILPNRAHDLLSHQGIARELASLLGIAFVDPTPLYKIPESKPTNLKIKVETEDCRRYVGRIVRNVTVTKSPDWVVKHLESIGTRSINNVVDAANIVMYDSGQPIHAFDLDKVSGVLTIRKAKEGEEILTLDNKQVKLTPSDTVIADDKNVLAIAGIKGGKIAEVDENTKNVIIEIANFTPVPLRKTRRHINIFTDAAKRFENDLSPTLCDFAMREMSGLLVEYGFSEFEEVVDIYNTKPEPRKLKFRLSKMSSMLGYDLESTEAEKILERYNVSFTKEGDVYEIDVPMLRLDLVIEEDMAEEFGRIVGYDRVLPLLPDIAFASNKNKTSEDISLARKKLLSLGYNEVMTYTFCSKGEVEVLASASDKKFLRTNITDGLKESIKLNTLNLPILGAKDLPAQVGVKVFEIGKVFKKSGEEWHVAYGDKKGVTESTLEEFAKDWKEVGFQGSSKSDLKDVQEAKFKMWSLYPFIVRDIALWVPEGTESKEVENVIREHTTELVVKGPDLFDTFNKEGKTSYAFRLVFQSFERTLTDEEVAGVVDKINTALKGHSDWVLR